MISQKKLTRRQFILTVLFHSYPQQTCQELTQLIAKEEQLDPKSNTFHYLSGSVSSLLRRMVKVGELQVIGCGGPKGGKTYCLTPEQYDIQNGK